MSTFRCFFSKEDKNLIQNINKTKLSTTKILHIKKTKIWIQTSFFYLEKTLDTEIQHQELEMIIENYFSTGAIWEVFLREASSNGKFASVGM